ncbi:MAG: hypothetical protein QXH37_00565 [Candidatus Bathyarchaeia archaeon]
MGSLTFLLFLLLTFNVQAQVPSEAESDFEWLPDGKLNYVYVWPADPSRWGLGGRSAYTLNLIVEENVYIDFRLTYVFGQDADLMIWLFNKMPIGIFEGSFSGSWLHQFNFTTPPTANIGAIQPINESPFVGAGYWWRGHVSANSQIEISGRLRMVNSTAADLNALKLAMRMYNDAYMPIADFITYGNQTLIPGMDLWNALGIPLPKSVVDVLQTMKQQEESFNQEKATLQAQISDLQKSLSSTQEQVNEMQSDLNSAQNTIESLQNQVSSLQAIVSSKQSEIDRLQSQLSQSQTMFYGSAVAAIVLLIVAVMFALRKRK